MKSQGTPKSHRAIALMLMTLCLTACSAAKLYPGPERPDSELATVKTDFVCESVTTIDDMLLSGRSEGFRFFGSKGGKVLPGKHILKSSRSSYYNYRNCQTSIYTDDYGLSNCENDRSEEIRKKGSTHKFCDPCNYQKKTQTCDATTHETLCEATVNFVKGKEYEILCDAHNEFFLTVDGARVGQCHDTPPRETTDTSACGSGCYGACPH